VSETSDNLNAPAENCASSSQQRVVRAQIVIHEPTVKLRYDKCGGVDVMLDDFVYVHINYDYRYTCNASRTVLANQIVEWLRPNSEASHAAGGKDK
jgi:hypothetical protein